MTSRMLNMMAAGLLLMLMGGCAPAALQVLPVPTKATGRPARVRPVENATAADKALVKEWRELAAQWETAPAARELLNHVRQPWNAEKVARLAEEVPGTPQEMAWARRYLHEQLGQLRQLKDWPKASEYAIRQAAQMIEGDVIDNDALWAPAEEIAIDYPLHQHARVTGKGSKATCRMLWDAKALHVLYQVTDGEVVAPFKVRDEAVWRGDCIELFVMANMTQQMGKLAYWELNVSPDGIIYDGLNFKYLDDFGGDIDTKRDMTEMRVFTRRTSGGYAVQVSLPWGCLPGLKEPVGKGTAVWMLAGWVDKAEGKAAEYYSHVPVLAWFHNIWAYSRFVLE